VSRPLGRACSAGLLALPLAAFLIGPAIGSFARDGVSGPVLYSVVPTLLTLPALAFVPLFVFTWTRSAARAVAFAVGSLMVALVGAAIYLLIVWPTGS
jgi:hypothetical protein